MKHRPRIAIPVPTSFDPAYNSQSWSEYAAAVERSGGEAVRVELTPGPRDLGTFDGILLPGSGADVSPARYGHMAEPETAPADPLREAVDIELLHQVESRRIPLLAICFGLQSLNVHRGGTLVQHLPPLPVNHRAGRPVLDAHSAIIVAGSRLAHATQHADQASRIMVNSSHHQAVAAPGTGLRITARSGEDGVVEALEDPEHPFCVGVQWHPERTYDHSAASQAIFQNFLAAVVAAGPRSLRCPA